MKKLKQKEIPPLLERYELKYTIPLDMVGPVCDFVTPYCTLDKYSSESENAYYRVNNLYLDSPDYHFLKMKLNRAENRFNMRIRSYGDPPSLPYFLEIKQKTGDVIRKYRTRVYNPDWYKSYTEPGYEDLEVKDDPIETTNEVKNKIRFERLVYTYNVAPKVFTQYLRKAWVSDVDDYARVTFDRDLRFRHATDYNLNAPEDEMISCDPEIVFDPGCSLILELKCYTAHVPLWMIDMIRYFNLRRRGFSKYGTRVFNVLELHQYDDASRLSLVN